MPSEYDLMRQSENEDEDAVERDELPPTEASFERSYTDYYNDVKLSHSTKEDW